MIIAFGHQKQVGKDTAVNTIYREYDNVIKYSLAGPLYEICGLLNKEFFSKNYYDANPEKKSIPMSNGKTPRQFLIEVGQKMKEVCGRDCWVNLAIDCAENIEPKHLLISDVRYREEADKLQEHGAVFFFFFRPDLRHTSDEADDDLLDWKGWDHLLVNDGTLEEFEREVITLYDRIKAEAWWFV